MGKHKVPQVQSMKFHIIIIPPRKSDLSSEEHIEVKNMQVNNKLSLKHAVNYE